MGDKKNKINVIFSSSPEGDKAFLNMMCDEIAKTIYESEELQSYLQNVNYSRLKSKASRS